MNIRYYLFGVFAALATTSCSNQDFEQPAQPTEGPDVIEASIESISDSRASIDQGKIYWSKGDKIAILLTSNTYGTLKLRDSDDGKASGSFTGTLFGYIADNYHAYYPHNIAKSSSTVKLPDTYEIGDGYENSRAFLKATLNNGSLVFKHLGAVIRFECKDVPAGACSFEYTTLDKKDITGDFNIVVDGSGNEVINATAGDGTKSTVIINFNTLTEKSDITMYVPMPVGTFTGLQVVFKDAEGNAVVEPGISEDVTFSTRRAVRTIIPITCVEINAGTEGSGSGSQTQTPENITLNSASELPILCGMYTRYDVKATWDQWSTLVLNHLGMTRTEFSTNYTLESIVGNPVVYTFDETTSNYVATSDFGNLVYDNTADQNTSHVITWEYDGDAALAIFKEYGNDPVNLYMHFVGKNGKPDKYIGLRIAIAGYPTVSFGTIAETMLFAEPQEVQMRVPQSFLGKSVFEYNSLLTDYYNGHEIKAIADASSTAYAGVDLSVVYLSYAWAPASMQMPGMYVAQFGNSSNLYYIPAYIGSVDNLSETDLQPYLVAMIDVTSGRISYGTLYDNNGGQILAATQISKQLLNAGTRNYNVWGKVQISATYGECMYPFASAQNDIVTIDFLKPIEVSAGQNVETWYSMTNTWNRVEIGKLFDIVDTWSNSLVYNGAITNNSLFEYYDIQSITIDCGNDRLYNAFSLSVVGSNIYDNGDGTYTYNVTSSSTSNTLKDASLMVTYQNSQMQNIITVPVKVTIAYSWGEQTVTVNVKVNPYSHA